jgi:tetratricopeptide (TPR) repeat protein
VQTRSEQEAQLRLLIDSAVALESQGPSVSLEVMSGLAGVNTQDIERYLSPLSTLPSGIAMLFAGVCALITQQGELRIEDQAESSVVGPNPVAGSIFTRRHLEFLFQSAITLYSADSLDACGRLLGLVLQQAPDYGAVHAALGMLAERQQNHEEVVRWYRSGIELLPEHRKIPLVLVNKLITLRRLDEARNLICELTPKFSDHPEFWSLNGLVAYEQHRFLDALEWFAKAAELDPGNIDYPHRIVSIHLGLGDFETANSVLAESLSRETTGESSPAGDLIHLEVLRVRACALSGHAEAALQMAQELHDRVPESFDAGICLADQLIAHSGFDSAKQLLDAIKPTDPGQEIKKLLSQVELASAKYDPDTAIDYAQKAIELEPTHIDAQTAVLGAQLMAADVIAAKGTMRTVDQMLKRHGREADRYKWRNSFHAGLLKEFRTNPHAEAKLTEILPLPSLQKIIALAKLFEHEPGYLPVSMGLLLQCRRHGVFDYDRPNEHAKVIPKTIVQFWDNPDIPADIARLMKSWDRCEGFEHRLFNDHSALAFIEENCTPRVLKAFRMANHPAMRSDIFRLAYLAVSGGIYVDADDLCRHDIGELLSPGFELILMQENLASIGNNFIAAAPGQRCIEFILSTIVDLVLEKQGNNVWFLTGPGALSSGFCRHYLQQLGRARLLAGIRVMTVYNLYDFVSPHIPCRHKNDERHWNSERVRRRSLFRRVA